MTDHVLWAFDAFSKTLSTNHGTYLWAKNHPLTITVTDGSSGQPVAGASVDGQLTDSQGHATITFTDIALKRLKAEKSDSIRSNALEVLITP